MRSSEACVVTNRYRFRRAESSGDAKRLHTLFSDVFHPEDVGTLAETMFHHLPRMKLTYWFIAEETTTAEIVSAFALIPWTWAMEGAPLRVAEMGIVGTQAKHRGHGLMRRLIEEFEKTLDAEQFDLAVIQGIPGFYHRFGYYYALPLENHINLPLHIIPEAPEKDAYAFRRAGVVDIPFLLREDHSYRDHFSIATVRDDENWRYLLTDNLDTEYGSDFWIMDHQGSPHVYCRIPKQGFGSGLILSEVSEHITYEALRHLLVFCKQLAEARKKPYIRLNLHPASTAGKMAVSMGAEQGKTYAWQIKIPKVIRLLKAMRPVLEKRVAASSFQRFSGTLRLNFYTTQVDLQWVEGRLNNVVPGEGDCADTFSINADLFPALCLGHRTWREIRYIRPDISPSTGKSRLLIETLFPSRASWIYEQY
jgi:predicted N-acetyltransferase YhbS